MPRELTQQILHELLLYDPHTGELTWRRRRRKWFTSKGSQTRWNKTYADRPAFTNNSNQGRYQGSVLGRPYLAHRVIWFWMTGAWPQPETDHKNGNPADNRFCNLREVTHQENARNQVLPRRNTSGHIGISFRRRNGCYHAYIGINHRRLFLGEFPTLELAVAARKAAERELGFYPGHGRARAD